MKAVLDAGLPALGFDYGLLDVDSDPDLVARFGETVPVLLRDGKPVAKVAISPEQLVRIVRRRR